MPINFNTQQAIQLLEGLGLSDFWLPFVLIFIITYAALQKSGILGDDAKKFNITISLVLGLLVTITHMLGKYPAGMDPIIMIQTAIPNVAVVLIAIVMVLILIGMFGGKATGGGMVGGIIALISFILIVYIFGNSAGLWSKFSFLSGIMDDPATQSLIVIILVFGMIVYFITKEDDNTGEGVGAGLKNLGDWFKRT